MAFISAPQHLGTVALTESGAFLRPSNNEVRVRPYPYPFVAALSISNDCDSMTRAAFEDWHAFVNGKGVTANGDGLGLEVDDSFWVWGGGRNTFAIHRHHPDHEPRSDSDDIGRIVELGRLGWLGTLHSFGNWRREDPPAGRAFRSQGAYALERLDQLGIKARTFVNHSGSPSNVGGPWGWYQRADDPNHPFYCFDLMKSYGLQFFWLDGCINFDKFGDYLEFSSADDLQREIDRFTWGHWLRVRRGDKGEVVLPLPMPEGMDEQKRLLLTFFNRTLIQLEARDGSPFWAFKRHRGWEQPVMDTFCTQVTESDLDQLERRRGAAVIYQHFGVSGPRGRSPALSRPHRRASTPPVFDNHARSRLKDIAERFRAGRLLVATTSRLLRYLWLREVVQYSVTKTAATWHVTIARATNDGGYPRITTEDLNGLSFLVPRNTPNVVVSFAEHATPLPVRRIVGDPHSQEDIVHLPWKPLEWPG